MNASACAPRSVASWDRSSIIKSRASCASARKLGTVTTVCHSAPAAGCPLLHTSSSANELRSVTCGDLCLDATGPYLLSQTWQKRVATEAADSPANECFASRAIFHATSITSVIRLPLPRHTAGLRYSPAVQGAHPKVIQSIMRHSAINLTMDTFMGICSLGKGRTHWGGGRILGLADVRRLAGDPSPEERPARGP